MQRKSPNSDRLVEAERWCARLMAADCTASERMEFTRWRATPENAAAYDATMRLWQSLGKLAGRPDLEQLSQQILGDTAPGPARGRRFAIAASIVLVLLGGGIFLAVQNREIPAVVYATKPGERSTVKLADGSQLVLNYATELEVRLGKDMRLLTLRRGEAFFTVAHDKTRPFKVAAGDGEVTALGTRFDVRKDAEEVAVTLVEGRVALDRPEQKGHVELQPGDRVRFTVTAPDLLRRKVDAEVVASWTTGRLRFRATPLAEALDEVNRYSTTQIRIVDPSLTDIPISGTFEIGDSASVVAALKALLPIQVGKVQDGQVQLQHR